MSTTPKKFAVKRFRVSGASLSAKQRENLVKQARAKAIDRKLVVLQKSDTASGAGHIQFAKRQGPGATTAKADFR